MLCTHLHTPPYTSRHHSSSPRITTHLYTLLHATTRLHSHHSHPHTITHLQTPPLTPPHFYTPPHTSIHLYLPPHAFTHTITHTNTSTHTYIHLHSPLHTTTPPLNCIHGADSIKASHIQFSGLMNELQAIGSQTRYNYFGNRD